MPLNNNIDIPLTLWRQTAPQFNETTTNGGVLFQRQSTIEYRPEAEAVSRNGLSDAIPNISGMGLDNLSTLGSELSGRFELETTFINNIGPFTHSELERIPTATPLPVLDNVSAAISYANLMMVKNTCEERAIEIPLIRQDFPKYDLQDPISFDRVEEYVVFIRSGNNSRNENIIRAYDLKTINSMIAVADKKAGNHIYEPYSRSIVTKDSILDESDLKHLEHIGENIFRERTIS